MSPELAGAPHSRCASIQADVYVADENSSRLWRVAKDVPDRSHRMRTSSEDEVAARGHEVADGVNGDQVEGKRPTLEGRAVEEVERVERPE